MAGALARYVYTSDDGTDYAIHGDISNNLAMGNVPATDEPGLPHGYHPRYVNATHPTTGRERRIIVGDPTNEVWIGPGLMTINLVDFGSTPSVTTTYNVLSRVGERRLNQG